MVSAYLNALKNDKNLSIKDISNLSGIPTSTLLKIFDGSTADPRVSTAYQVVKAMGGSLDEMVGIKPVSQMDTINDRASEKVPVRIPCAEYHLRHRNYYHFNFLKTY